jgi:hypothetical protein
MFIFLAEAIICLLVMNGVLKAGTEEGQVWVSAVCQMV